MRWKTLTVKLVGWFLLVLWVEVFSTRSKSWKPHLCAPTVVIQVSFADWTHRAASCSFTKQSLVRRKFVHSARHSRSAQIQGLTIDTGKMELASDERDLLKYFTQCAHSATRE